MNERRSKIISAENIILYAEYSEYSNNDANKTSIFSKVAGYNVYIYKKNCTSILTMNYPKN